MKLVQSYWVSGIGVEEQFTSKKRLQTLTTRYRAWVVDGGARVHEWVVSWQKNLQAPYNTSTLRMEWIVIGRHSAVRDFDGKGWQCGPASGDPYRLVLLPGLTQSRIRVRRAHVVGQGRLGDLPVLRVQVTATDRKALGADRHVTLDDVVNSRNYRLLVEHWSTPPDRFADGVTATGTRTSTFSRFGTRVTVALPRSCRSGTA